ncbi:trehalose-6-phosphate phosphatase [Mycena metata]|uniref:Trehalose-6-phosphate phosphatase n=1 Tax=Mycena metata TaxID=1033252 RepID=A0AAD7H5K9_9AGAR|nr:trehalose-6-phosphate phosphatase [Mycena metata]
MDSFAEPYTRLGDDISLDEVRAQVRALEADHRAAGIPLSGRVLHVCHYLPVQATLNRSPSTDEPPLTPPPEADSPVLEEKADDVWSLVPRYGHAAMISGIRSLSATHEQLIIGWTGDIQAAPPAAPLSSSTTSLAPPPTPQPISSESVTEEERAKLEEALGTYQPAESDPDDDRKTVYVPVWLEDAVAHGHYDGYCKQTLWPLFHYLLWQDIASEDTSQDAHYAAYAAANQAFAERIKSVWRPGDLIYIHDYHLLLLPRLLRLLIPDAHDSLVIGLFVHTPFPSSEVFRCLPRRLELLRGMAAADLVCFQTYSYKRHFISTCVRVCGYESTPRGIDAEGHVAAVAHCPVGVDAERVGRDILRPGIQPKLDALRALYEGKKIIVGRDKLDVVKGVLQKLHAFQKLLQTYPQWVGNVVLIQVTSPALTDSPKLERQVSELVANINGEFGSLDFIPVHHYHQTLKKDEFYALLSVADLAVITPLRDGMNTTSMEFVIAQGRTKRSPVVLSEFMGISKHMENALMVNPWNLGDVAAAINQGLIMSEPEKLSRHEELHRVVTTHTSHTWAAVLVKMLLSQMGGKESARATPYIPRDVLESRYHAAKKRLFFFDYDGTLAPIVKTPSMAVPTPATLQALETLSADPRNVVYIISGRDGAFLEQHLGHLKNVGFSAEHGGFVRAPGPNQPWVNFTEKLDMSWMGEVEEVFRYYTERTTGSHIEMKKSSITWHYRASDPEWGLFQCRQCQDLLENNLAHKRPIEVLVGKKNLEVRPIAVNKGEIVKRLLYLNPDAEFVFCAGDDKTDEDMFRALILFGTGSTKATLPAPLSVTLVDDENAQPVELAIKPDCVFTTAVGQSSKRTLASWHVTTPAEIVEHMLGLVGVATPKEEEEKVE